MSLPLLSQADKQKIDTVLSEKLDIAALHPFQMEVVSRVLKGESVLAVMATGAGKSLCYQLPSLLWDQGVVIISPLVALMHQQAERMIARGIAARALTGQLDEGEQRRILEEWRSGDLRMLYAAPERLGDRRFRDLMRDMPPKMLVVDEAHCISEWGYDFRPEYRRIRVFREFVGHPPLLALTATATERVKADIRWHLTVDAEPFALVQGPVDRPNVFLAVQMALDSQQQRRTVARLAKDAGGGVIIYAQSRKQVEQWAQFLKSELKETVAAYHAGLAPERRRLIERGFGTGALRVVTATTAFGMGIDRGDIRRVIHVAVPESLDSYYQEIGRAGRDGKPAQAVMVVQPLDVHRREQWIQDDKPDPEWTAAIVGRIAAQPLGRPVLWELDDFETRIPVILSVLEDRGALAVAPASHGLRVIRRVEDVMAHQGAALNRLNQFWELRRSLFAAMSGYIDSAGCRRRALLQYYGQYVEVRERCCDQCVSGGHAQVPPRADGGLVERLRNWRTEQSRVTGMEPYIILSDRDLVGIASKMPATLEELAQCRGMGPKRLKKYGEELLTLTGASSTPTAQQDRGVDQTSPRDRAVWHFRAGTPPDQVMREVGRSASTVRGYFIDWVAQSPEDEWVHYLLQWFSEADYQAMAGFMDQLGTDRLRPLFDAAAGRYSFSDWAVARAVYQRRHSTNSSP